MSVQSRVTRLWKPSPGRGKDAREDPAAAEDTTGSKNWKKGKRRVIQHKGKMGRDAGKKRDLIGLVERS